MRQAERKDPQRAVVRILKWLGSPLDGAVAKDHPLEAVTLAKQPNQFLLRQLAQSVGTGRPSHRLVGHHRGDRAATNRTGRIPDASLQGVHAAWLRIDIAVLAAAILPLPVDRHRGAEND